MPNNLVKLDANRRFRQPLAWLTLLSVMAGPALASVRIRKHKYAPGLDEIISHMSEAGKRLKTLSANLEYTKVTVLVNDKSTEIGEIYFHESKSPEIMIKIEKPDAKVILLKKNLAELYNPKINQVQEYDLEEHSGLVQQFFLLGFGKGTENLKKHYDIKLAGEENLDGDTTASLELAPRNDSDAGQISKIILWVSEESWLPVQQKFFEPSGDYVIARYTGVKVNRPLPIEFRIDAAPGAKRAKMN